MDPLPLPQKIQSSLDTLAQAVTILFEHSPILISKLVPQLSTVKLVESYEELIDISLSQIAEWDDTSRAQFIAGHPRIGESKNLSALSSKEQGAPTPPEVLRHLEYLNEYYERRYPGLRYITFVNGRSRAAVAEEMEDRLGLTHSFETGGSELEGLQPLSVDDEDWRNELDRALKDIGLIAHNRLKALGVQ